MWSHPEQPEKKYSATETDSRTMAAQVALGSSSSSSVSHVTSHVKSLVGLAVDTLLHRAATLDQVETADLHSCAYIKSGNEWNRFDLTGGAGEFPKTVKNHVLKGLLNHLGVIGVEILQVEDLEPVHLGIIFKYRWHKDLRFAYPGIYSQSNPKLLSFPGAIGVAGGTIWFRRPRTTDDPPL